MLRRRSEKKNKTLEKFFHAPSESCKYRKAKGAGTKHKQVHSIVSRSGVNPLMTRIRGRDTPPSNLEKTEIISGKSTPKLQQGLLRSLRRHHSRERETKFGRT